MACYVPFSHYRLGSGGDSCPGSWSPFQILFEAKFEGLADGRDDILRQSATALQYVASATVYIVLCHVSNKVQRILFSSQYLFQKSNSLLFSSQHTVHTTDTGCEECEERGWKKKE